MRLKDKKALLIGAATGIGRATAFDFYQNGASVVIADINKSGADTVANELGENASSIYCDVSSEDSVAEAVTEAETRLSEINTIVVFAGQMKTGEINSFAAADWDSLFQINVRGTFFVAKHGLPAMIKAGGGSFITTSSLAGLRGAAGMAAYASAKGAVLAFTTALAQEMAPHNIRVNSVLPGWIDTPFNESAIKLMGGAEKHQSIVERLVPLGRQGTPEEVAPIYTFLASEESRYITAKQMMVDGGMAH